MTKLNQQLRVRLSLKQMRELINAIASTKNNKSSLVRSALHDYLNEIPCRTEKNDKNKPTKHE